MPLVYEIGHLSINTKNRGIHEKISSVAGVYHKVLYTILIEYKRDKIIFRIPEQMCEVDCSYTLKAGDADDSIDDPYGSDIMDDRFEL